MSAWNDRSLWADLCSGVACPICRRGAPLHVVATLEASWATMHEAAPVRGYVCLVSRTHAVELHDLPEAAAAAFMRDVQETSRAVAAVTQPVKMNYEIHGNCAPPAPAPLPSVSRRQLRGRTDRPACRRAASVRTGRVREDTRCRRRRAELAGLAAGGPSTADRRGARAAPGPPG